ncbi:hypothetical protein F4677DRAFT_322368 [Hypoxylon crocopeplum]|nr:hypothetical protein F4677DRAFT_322368 [Hypoxylon crocopeplum]
MHLLKWTSPRWSLSRWLLFARLLQASGTLVTALMNGFLLVYIHLNHLGLAGSMFCLEMMACSAFIYSSIVLLMQHAGSRQRRSSTALTTAFIIGDIFFNGMMIAIITVLSHTGLPTDCHGLTREDNEVGDAPNDPGPGFNTIRFGDKDRDIKGQLDKYCALEKGFYFVAAALVFTYMLSVTLGALRLSERRLISNGLIDPLFASANNIHQLDDMRPKIHSPNPNSDLENIVPPSEGVLTPTSRSNPSLQTQGIRSTDDVQRNRGFQEQARTQSLAVSPVSVASPISQVSPISPVAHQHGTFMASTDVLDTTMGGLMIEHSTDLDAEAAMVSDGFRHRLQPGMPSLPPYSPGHSRGQFMDGHGDESNEMRLSDYVKGETRAQNMKDSGMGM